jgi:hypothetical protein
MLNNLVSVKDLPHVRQSKDYPAQAVTGKFNNLSPSNHVGAAGFGVGQVYGGNDEEVKMGQAVQIA